MQTCSCTKHFEQKQQEEALLVASPMKKIRDMKDGEKVAYWKYIRNWQKLAEAKERREASRIFGIRFRDKKKTTEKCGCTEKDARVQPYPEASEKIETKNADAGALLCPKVPTVKAATLQKVFPIYSQGTVCGYFYANENEIPPQKVALTNFRSTIRQSLPGSLVVPPLIKPKQVTQAPKITTAPRLLATLTTLLLNNVPSNTLTPDFATRKPLPLPQTVNTLQMMRMGKPLDEPQPLNVVPILPAPMKVQHFIPATMQTNNIRLSSGNLLCVTTNSSNQNKTNVIPTLLQPAGCNVKNNNSQSTFLRSENQNGNTIPFACPGPFLSSGKQASDNGTQGTKQSCKVRKVDRVCIKTEAACDSPFEENEQQLESDVHQKKSLSSSLSVSAPVIKTEMPHEDKKNSISHKTEQENDYGLVISSFFSLSKANASWH